MENFREFDKEQKQNWLKGVVALICLQKPLELFIDEEIGIFHRELLNECGPDHCVKTCDFKNWKPRPNQRPPFECEVCSRWRDVIWPNHTSQHGKVMWLNSKPHLWSQEKWEVAKVYMPDGHKNHKSIGDFDIAALLCLMNQCKHFKKFQLGGLCDQVANVRNKIMHAPRYQLEQKDLQDYFSRITELGEVLARHDAKFTSLSNDINEIQNPDYRLVLPDNVAAQNNLAQDEKELGDILFAAAQEAAEHHITRMKLEKLEGQIAQQEQDNLAAAQEAAEHHLTRMKLEKLERQIAQQEQDNLADYYALIHKPRGLCVIFNNEEFLGPELKYRRGSQEDTRALHTVFTRLGFDVVIHNNLTARDMRRELKELGSRDFSNDDALVICVLSHGRKECVFGTDEQKVYIRELTQPFTSERAQTLREKPKLFFIQACQGSYFQRGLMPCPPIPRHEEGDRQILLQEGADAGHEDAGHPEPMLCPPIQRQVKGDTQILLQEGADASREDAGGPRPMLCPPRQRQGEGDSQSCLEEDADLICGDGAPWDDDFLLGMATVSECTSFRNVSTGSIYIQELCVQLTRAAGSLGKVDILDVLTRVNREVSRQQFANIYRQIPEPKYTLTKKLVLKFV